MKHLLQREELIGLVNKIQCCEGTEEEQDKLVDKALSYQPIYL